MGNRNWDVISVSKKPTDKQIIDVNNISSLIAIAHQYVENDTPSPGAEFFIFS